MSSWPALRTFANELRRADPYGPLVGNEVVSIFSPFDAPGRGREGSFPIASFLGGGPGGSGSFPIFGDNGELNAFQPGLAPDAFYMFGGETEGDGDDGLFVKQNAEPETFGAEELHNPDIEVSIFTVGTSDAAKQLNAGIVCGNGWSAGISDPGPYPPASSGDGIAVPISPPDIYPEEPEVYPDSPDAIEPPAVIIPPIPPPGPVPVPLFHKAVAIAGTQSNLELLARAEGYRQNGTFAARAFTVRTPPNNVYSVRIKMTRTSATGTLTPSFQGGGPTNVGTPINVSDGLIEQRILNASPHTKLVLTKSADFAGEVLWASVRWVRKRKTGAKKFLTLADGVTKAWYKRTPEEITLERCGIGNVRSDDEANMGKVQNALNDAQEWARDTGIAIKLGPKTYCVNGRPAAGSSTGAFHISVGDNITIEGCGKQSVLLNCKDDYYGVITVQGGNNITLRNFTIDSNCYAHPFVYRAATETEPANSGGASLLFYNRSAVTERLLIENLWCRRMDGYGVGVQSADIKSAIINGLFLEDCGADGIDFKQYSLDNRGDSARGALDRKHAILNNIHVTGFGRAIKQGGTKTGIDLRGYILASNLFIHDMKRATDLNVFGIRLNADVGSNAGREGGRTSQISNARVVCTETDQSMGANNTGRCIGMGIWAKDVNVSNYVCEGAHTGIEVTPAGPDADTVTSVSLSNIRINGARGTDGTGRGIYWSGSDGSLVTDPPPLRSGYSQLGPFTISDCDRGLEVRGPYLRGSGIIRDCTTGLYVVNQEIADKTELDIHYERNVTDIGAAIAGVTHYLSRTIKLTTTNIALGAAEITEQINTLAERGGGELVIDDVHTVNAAIVPAAFGDIQIVLNGRHGRPTIKAVKSATLPHTPDAALIRLNTAVKNTGKLLINNLEIDCTDGGNFTIGGNTAGMSLHNWRTAHLYDFGGAGGNGTTGRLSYDQGIRPFVVGLTVTGQDSQAVGTVVDKTQGGVSPNITGTLGIANIINGPRGSFIDNELLLGAPTTGGQALSVGQLRGNLSGDQCLSTISIYDFLWQAGYARHWNDAGFYPGGDNTPDGIPYIAQISNFTEEDLIIGGDSGASGILAHQVDGSSTTGTLYLNNIRGQFLPQEPISGLSSTGVVRGAATTNGSMTGQLGDGFTHNVRNVIFEHCSQGVIFKREGYSLHVEDCTFRYCDGGVSTASVSAFLGGGRTLEVGNSRFFNMNAASPLQGTGDCRVFFHDNLIRDWGRWKNGDVLPSGGIRPAVRIQGCRDFVVNNNVYEMINWLPSGDHAGILVQQFSDALATPAVGVLKYDGQSGAFHTGTVLIGLTSHAQGEITGLLDYVSPVGTGELYLKNVFTGPFQDNEVIQDAFGGAALANGTLTGPVHTPFGGISRGNTYRNLDMGVRESLAGSNNYLDEYFDNVIDPTPETYLSNGSTLSYSKQRATFTSNDTSAARHEHIGLMHRIATPGIFVYSGTGGFTLTSGTHVSTVQLTASISIDTILTLDISQAGNGASFHVVRTGAGAGLWQIWDNEGIPSLVKTLVANTWCDVQHDGTRWKLIGYGAL